MADSSVADGDATATTENDVDARKHCPTLLTDRPLLDDALKDVQSSDKGKALAATGRYCAAVDTYLQLPALLDPILSIHIPALCTQILSGLSFLKSETAGAQTVALPARALYTLVKVRGPKRVTTHFPHAVADLRSLIPALCAVEGSLSSCKAWHPRYALYLWLSVAVRVPFPLSSILEPGALDGTIEYAHQAIRARGPVADAATAFLARFLSRRDADSHRPVAFQRAIAALADPAARAASLALLAAVFKHANRDDLRAHIRPVLEALPSTAADATATEAHLIAKLAQRLALAFIAPRPAAWRYKRTLPVLRRVAGHVGPVQAPTHNRLDPSDAHALEDVLDLLLAGLRQADTIVRWSAAKGVARITARLHRELAMDVIDAVLAVFHDVQQARADAAWHGACLAIAELARRGLLLPANPHFRDAFQAIRSAAAFDVRRGAISVGAHVRDAACYAVWAVARAYAREDVAPFAPMICEAMLPLALLDREVNCRRAAAAALQECVGRLSADLFIDGIKLITLADYFSLGDRNAAYLSIAPKVAQIGGGIHFDAIVKELWSHKLVHWDSAVRSLSARALAAFINVDKNGAIVRQVLPKLISMATQKGDMIFRHGAVLGIAELSGIVGIECLEPFGKEIRQIPKSLQDKKLLTGRTGDEMRIACCHMIQSVAEGASGVYSNGEQGQKDAELSLEFLEAILGCGKEQMYAAATSAYAAMCSNVIAGDQGWHVRVMKRIMTGICSDDYFERQRGFALAAGACGDSSASKDVVKILCRESKMNKDVEVRRNCVISLGSIPDRVTRGHRAEVLQGLAVGMNDHAIDDRGDVGSWVREASMRSACKVFKVVWDESLDQDGSMVDEETEAAGIAVLNGIMEQCCSRIDRTRGVAGRALEDMIVMFGQRQTQEDAVSKLCDSIGNALDFKAEGVGNGGWEKGQLKWGDFVESATAFRTIQKGVCIPQIRRSIMRGLISAAGGTGQQAMDAMQGLVENIESKEKISGGEGVRNELNEVVWILENRDERLVVSALITLDSLLKSGALRSLAHEEVRKVVQTVKGSWRGRIRDVKRVEAAVEVLSEIGSSSGGRKCFEFGENSCGRDCLEAMAVLLGGPIPRVRRLTAENLYMVLLEVSEDTDEEFGHARSRWAATRAALDVLADTCWEGLSVAQARRRRNEVCRVLGIRAPVLVRATDRAR